ncbi:hypothetical protein NQ315_011149 [Exocentrus adspersus]|uniref:RNase H type-1 domain-containing protein n=1 Tax=Exocentrus adspersus TaxID=1586481 RepID=A0AAV8VXC9_9CUCU|nr:hypothetical protein NQ315_011149 [Exocentrus adspersus]
MTEQKRTTSALLKTRSILVQESGEVVESLARQKELVWMPEHMGILGNKRADQLARLGSGGTLTGTRTNFRGQRVETMGISAYLGGTYLIGIEESPLCAQNVEKERIPLSTFWGTM